MKKYELTFQFQLVGSGKRHLVTRICGGNKGYEFAFRPLNSNIEEKTNDICVENNGWNYIREEYLKLKNINEGKKKPSFSLYIEAVNNVYNQMFLQ